MQDMKRINNKLKSVSSSYLNKRDQNDQFTNQENSTKDGSNQLNEYNKENKNKFDNDFQVANRYFDNEANFWKDIQNENIDELNDNNHNQVAHF